VRRNLNRPSEESPPGLSAPKDGGPGLPGLTTHIGSVRWKICALLFFATSINYVDRQVLSILVPDLQKALGWSEVAYGNIVAAFQGAYALGLLLVGSLIDRIGTRRGYAAAVIFWSIAAAAHALVQSAFGFGVVRFALGLGEAANFPAAVKTVAEWFPKKERALATGIFNAGSNIGALLAPLTVPWITVKYGWQWAFVATASLGLLWLVFWLAMYRSPEEHPGLGRAEYDYIRGDAEPPSAKVSWVQLLPHRQTWAFAVGKFMTDPAWWVYLSWLPKFLHSRYGLTLDKLGLPLVVIYLLADVGSVAGGGLSSYLIRRGAAHGRLAAMLVCAALAVPVMSASRAGSLWVAVLLIGLAAAAHQGWSANLYTLVSDTFPRRAVGSVVGIGGMAGALSGMFAASAVGYLLERTHGNYTPVFLFAGFAYLAALLIITVMNPYLKPATFPAAAPTDGLIKSVQ